ncbi:DEKNAAC103904 [Brettanomyces naardenensis]|uniref:DEKNAAC103904 n=1 Tax=Brettanomyces naardenensis TaxID=13370 RepID=A0A448YPG8_BRENA|nr:DEKNAAC103904 [Brettanomyces naardenensis]
MAKSKTVTFTDGSQFELNDQFCAAALTLSDELNLDEVVAAEILFKASNTEAATLGVQFIDLGRVAYHTRRLYILEIVGYELSSGNTTLFSNLDIVSSFKQIEAQLDSVSQSVQRAKLLGTYNSDAVAKSVAFCRDSLFKQQQLLGEVFWAYLSIAGHHTCFTSSLTYLNTLAANDISSLCLLPGIVRYTSSLSSLWKESDIISFHSSVIADTQNPDKLSESPMKALVDTIFLTNFISWCKDDPSRSKQFPFESSVSEPLKRSISIGGSLEMFLCASADTSLVDSANSDTRITPFYDFRSFLQRHIPKLIPVKLLDDDGNAAAAATTKEYQLSSHFTSILAPELSSFALSFIANAAFILTDLRDTEEDLLLSSEELDLDAIAENADLERFYVALFYLYSERPSLASQFWLDKSSTAYGFLQWASKCNSPLIISTFCLFLASLASGSDNAINTFNFLQITNEKVATTSTSLLGKFSSVSWSTIYSSLAYYNKAMKGSTGDSSTTAPTVLGEDSIIFISGMFQVLSEVARNSDQARSGLLLSDDYQLLKILGDFLSNSTPLGGSAMVVLSSLVGQSIEDRYKVWQLLDNWLFWRQIQGHGANRPQDVIRGNLTTFSLVSGFATLVSALLNPQQEDTDPFSLLTSPFPADLGSRVHRPGIWSYLDVISELFVESQTSNNLGSSQRLSLQLTILTLFQRCLSPLDPNLVLNASAAHLKDLDNICANHNVIRYLQSHQGSAVICLLSQPSVHNALFDLASIGIDAVNELAESSVHVILVQKALQVLSMLLDRQLFFSDELLPVLRLTDNPFAAPSDVATSGLASFYDALLLKLPLVAHISLYVSSSKLELASVSLQVLKKIAASSVMSGTSSDLLSQNRLLTLYETIDESRRIRFAFIEQFESPIEPGDPESLAIKIDILKFLLANLTGGQLTISHFLLGFDTRRSSLGDANDEGSILSMRSLLRTLVCILKDTAKVLGKSTNVDFSPARLCSLILEVVLKLCEGSNGTEILQFLRRFNLVFDLLSNAEKVYGDYYWSGKQFDGEYKISNSFVSSGDSSAAITAFTAYRSRLLRLSALELRSVASSGSVSLNLEYVNLLTDAGLRTGSMKLLDLLDLVEFQPHNRIEKVDDLFAGFNFYYILQKIVMKSSSDQQQTVYDTSIVDDLVSLYGKESQSLGLFQKSEKKNTLELFSKEKLQLCQILVCTISFDSLRAEQLEYLRAWSLLVQVLVSDGRMETFKKDNFVVEVLQSVVPKMEDYMRQDGAYAEELVGMCVSLVGSSSYDSSSFSSLAATAISGISLPQSSPSLRSDFYVLLTSYITRSLSSKPALTDLMILLRSADQRLFHVVCNDSLVAEGSCRISALLLLESIVKATTRLQKSPLESNFVTDVLCKSNYLFLLVQKLKAIDDVIARKDPENATSLSSLLYEFTACKTAVYLLIRIAETRFGAQQLLNCGVFSVIKDCRFLSTDPDLGVELSLKENERFIDVRLSLDSKPVSLCEVLVPIFRLVTAIVISLGPQNKACIQQAGELENYFSKLIEGVLKREAMGKSEVGSGVNELARLFLLMEKLLETEQSKVDEGPLGEQVGATKI